MNDTHAVVTDKQYWKTRGAAWLWVGLLLGPFAWALDLGISYALVQWECGTHTTLPLHLVSLVCVLITIAGVVLSRSCLRSLPAAKNLDAGTPLVRGRFMALAGVVLNGLFCLVIIANSVPRFFLGPCQQ